MSDNATDFALIALAMLAGALWVYGADWLGKYGIAACAALCYLGLAGAINFAIRQLGWQGDTNNGE